MNIAKVRGILEKLAHDKIDEGAGEVRLVAQHLLDAAESYEESYEGESGAETVVADWAKDVAYACRKIREALIDGDEVARVAGIAAANGWTGWDVAGRCECEADVALDVSLEDVITSAVLEGDDLCWIEEFVSERERPLPLDGSLTAGR